jgi:sn-glycerol 3-phosphate transport system substrate-binding protein
MAEPSRRSVVASSMGCTALLVVLVAGGACTGDDDEAPAGTGAAAVGPAELASCDGPPPGRHVEITFAHGELDNPERPGERADRIAGYVDQFEAENPGIDVNVVPVREGHRALLESWRGQPPEERPELIMEPQTANARLIDSGQIVAPGACIHQVAPDMLESISQAWSANGVLQAVPFAVSTPVLLYDRRMFRRAGLDPERPPRTLDDLRRAALQITTNQVAEYGLVFDTGPEGGASWFLEQVPARAGQVAVEPENGRQGSASSVTWRSGLALGTLRWLADGKEAGWAHSVGRNTKGIENLLAATNPRTSAAMTLHTSGALREIFDGFDAGTSGGIDLGVAPLPRPEEGLRDDGGHGSVPGGSALWITGGQSEAETAAAWALAAYLVSPDVQADWAAATGYVPLGPTVAGRPEVVARWREHPGMGVAYEVLAEQETSPEELGPLVGPLAEIHELQAVALDKVIAEGSDPADALTVAADDADRLLEAYARSRPDPPDD